jgi:polysaccharide export outer membrane protein
MYRQTPLTGSRWPGVALLVLACFGLPALLAQESAAPAGGQYRLGAGDRIEIRVFGQPEFSVTMRIPPDGTVSFPGLKSIALLHRTAADVEDEISRRLQDGKFLKNPLVTVLVTEFAPQTVYVLGRVREPGEFEIPIGRDLLLSHAISMAQGFADDADLANVGVIRRVGDRERHYHLDFRAVESGQAEALNMVLRTGDQVVVPELRSAYVVGEVRTPGEVALPTKAGLTVSRVLSLAGGFSERTADLADVRIFRVTGSTTRTIVVDVQSHLEGDAKGPEPLVEPGDLVYVPRRGVF